MKTSKQLVILGIALLGLAIGYLGDPIGNSSRVLKSKDFELLNLNVRFAPKKLDRELRDYLLPRSIPPKYSDLKRLRRVVEHWIYDAKNKMRESAHLPQPSDRTPIPIENSYFDAKLEDFEKSIRVLAKEKIIFKKEELEFIGLELKKFLRLPVNKNY